MRASAKDDAPVRVIEADDVVRVDVALTGNIRNAEPGSNY